MPETQPSSPNTSPGRSTYSAKLKWESMMDRCWKSLQKADCIIICVIICCLAPAVVVLALVTIKNMAADDGITTTEELQESLRLAKINCERMLQHAPAPTDKNGNLQETFCKGEWDMLTCWPHSLPGFVDVPCPKYVEDFDHTESIRRFCNESGHWIRRLGNESFPDYHRCHHLPLEEGELEDLLTKGDPTYQRLVSLYNVGYSVSLVTLIFALATLAYFKRLHCTRNYIHMHLFVSFILRAIAIFVKDRVLFFGSGILDVNADAIHQPTDASNITQGYEVGCKIVMTLFHYFLATNYYWILVEALYLHSLIFVAFFSDRRYLWRFIFTGWGIPILFVVPWAIVRARFDDTSRVGNMTNTTSVPYSNVTFVDSILCWDLAVHEYKWIYIGPIVVANVINFLLFLNIIRVLFQKLKERELGKKSDQYKQYMKLAKATLVLIPLFGVHAFVFIWMPDSTNPDSIWWHIRMYFDLFFNSFQGFFVAIIYCFLNGEVQAEVKRAWERFNDSMQIQRGRRERSRSSVTMLTNFNSSYSQGGRLSISENGRSQMVGSATQDGDSKPLIYDNSNVDEESTSRYRASFIRRTYSDSLQRNSNTELILPIAEEGDIEEKAFETAVETVISDKLPINDIEMINDSVFSSKDTKYANTHLVENNSSIDSGYSKDTNMIESDNAEQSSSNIHKQTIVSMVRKPSQ